MGLLHCCLDQLGSGCILGCNTPSSDGDVNANGDCHVQSALLRLIFMFWSSVSDQLLVIVHEDGSVRYILGILV